MRSEAEIRKMYNAYKKYLKQTNNSHEDVEHWVNALRWVLEK